MGNTKKDYVIIAGLIKEHTKKAGYSLSGNVIPERIIPKDFIQALCKIYKAENPLFNEERFIKACGF